MSIFTTILYFIHSNCFHNFFLIDIFGLYIICFNVLITIALFVKNIKYFMILIQC